MPHFCFSSVGFVGIVLDKMLELHYPFDFMEFNEDWFCIIDFYIESKVVSLTQGQHVSFL